MERPDARDDKDFGGWDGGDGFMDSDWTGVMTIGAARAAAARRGGRTILGDGVLGYLRWDRPDEDEVMVAPLSLFSVASSLVVC